MNIKSIITGVLVVPIILVTGAMSASAYTQTALNSAVNKSLNYASAHGFYMAPMSNAGISTENQRWCSTYTANLRAGIYGPTASNGATNSVASRIGYQKATAIKAGAYGTFC